MRTLAALTIATAVTAATFAIAQPAAADPYVDPVPPGVATYTFEEYCRDYAYRVRHPTCARFYDDDSSYYRSGNYYYYDGYGRRYERKYRKHHYDRDDDRGDRYEDRDRDW